MSEETQRLLNRMIVKIRNIACTCELQRQGDVPVWDKDERVRIHQCERCNIIEEFERLHK